MVITVHVILLLAAAASAVLAALGVGSPRVSLGWLGLGLLALAFIFS